MCYHTGELVMYPFPPSKGGLNEDFKREVFKNKIQKKSNEISQKTRIGLYRTRSASKKLYKYR